MDDKTTLHTTCDVDELFEITNNYVKSIKMKSMKQVNTINKMIYISSQI